MNDLLRKAKQYFINKGRLHGVLKKDTCILIVLLGVLFMVIQLPVKQKDETGNRNERKNVRQLSEENLEWNLEEYKECQNGIEARMEQILSKINGVGRVSVMITLKRDDGFELENDLETNVEGVLVVAEGGDDPSVNLMISEACQALFGIEAHKIVIVKGNALERRTE